MDAEEDGINVLQLILTAGPVTHMIGSGSEWPARSGKH